MANDWLNNILASGGTSTNIEDRRNGFTEDARVRNAFKDSLINPNPTTPTGRDVLYGPINVNDILLEAMKSRIR